MRRTLDTPTDGLRTAGMGPPGPSESRGKGVVARKAQSAFAGPS
jgi:hypothetical protein